MSKPQEGLLRIKKQLSCLKIFDGVPGDSLTKMFTITKINKLGK